MTALGDVFEGVLLDSILGGNLFAGSANIEFALSTADPLDDGSGLTEPVGNNYSRVTVANDFTTWSVGFGGSKSNAIVISFPTASGSWGTITHWAMLESGGFNYMMFRGALTTPVAVAAGQTPKFRIGDLVITLD